MRSYYSFSFLFIWILQLFFSLNSSASTVDSTEPGFVAKMEAFFQNAAKTSKLDVENDRAMIRQNLIIEEIKTLGHQSRFFLKKGFDSVEIDNEVTQILELHAIAKDGVFEHKGTAQSSRNLTATYNILNALSLQLKDYKKEIDRYQNKLASFRLNIDSLSSDAALFIFPKDSSDLVAYVNRLRVVSMEIIPILNNLSKNIKLVHERQNRINIELMKLESDMEEIQYFQSRISYKTFEREFVNIWLPSKFERPLSDILFFSFSKEKILYWYYLQAHWGKLTILLLATLFIVIYIYALRKKAKESNIINTSLLLNNPLNSGLLIGLGVFQFIFPSPPFILTISLLSLSAILLSLILQKSITRYWMLIWSSIALIFIISGVDNLVLQASRTERWLMLGISVTVTAVGLIALLNKKRHRELVEKWILFPIALMVILELISLGLNIFGRFNLAKVILISGLTNVVVCILFLWILRLVNEGLQLASSLYNKQERRLFYINYNRVGKRAPLFFYLLLIVGWFILFGRNFYEFKFLADPLKDFLLTDHQLGSYRFSVYNLAIFLTIMVTAMIISKVVSFFASDSPWNSREDHDQNRFTLGSWILLIRITIVMAGFFLAFSALGIPLEQLGIVIGALGVGIGFGLQTLVNNLVSGLIIAFEKPVNVNDQIQVGDQIGKVKSIGFRSSIISTPNGADLIMPNGDLLNAHVLNWTLAGGKKRLNIPLEVTYGADLNQVKTLLENIIRSDGQIISTLGVEVDFTHVSAHAVTIEIHFWIKSMKNDSLIKSDILKLICDQFKEEGIELSIPKQELILNQIERQKNNND